jgi:hypothetical protein
METRRRGHLMKTGRSATLTAPSVGETRDYRSRQGPRVTVRGACSRCALRQRDEVRPHRATTGLLRDRGVIHLKGVVA